MKGRIEIITGCMFAGKSTELLSRVEESKSKAIKFCIENNSLSLSVESQSKGSANEMIDVNYSGDKVDIGFNSKYIIDICNEVDGDEISISLSDSISPAIILDKTDENLFFVLMPMRI